MDRIMRLLDVYPTQKYSGSAETIPEGKKQYYIREGSYGAFYPGRCCDVDKETVREEEERES